MVGAHASQTDGLVATVGQIDIHPNVSNVIPGRVTLSLDVRHQNDSEREQAIAWLRERGDEIRMGQAIESTWQLVQENRAVLCDPALTGLLARAIEAQGYPAWRVPSGAGHDGVMLSSLTPIAMLFVRCKGGISHNPAESVAELDVAVAIDVLKPILEFLGVDIGD